MFEGPGEIILFIVYGSEDGEGDDDDGGCEDDKAKYTKGLGSP